MSKNLFTRFTKVMQILNANANSANRSIQQNKNKIGFKGFANLSASVEQNAVLNRSLIDAGGIVPWLFSCNNKEEKKERLYNLSIFFALAFFAPIINVPIANRIAMKCFGLTDSLFDNNHKAIQLSNEYLTDKNKIIPALEKYNISKHKDGSEKVSERFFTSPIETLYRKLTKKPVNNTVDIKKLLAKCADNPEILRKKLIKSKNLVVLASDLLITGITLGSLGFLNNYMTKKRTGKSGFSAELEMADSQIIKQRAEKYEKNKKKNAAILLTEIAAISTVIPFAVYKGMSSIKNTAFNNFVKGHSNYLNYNKGIYMSRFTMLLGMIMNTTGLIIASRNDTERKDWTIRTLITTPVFMGGDLLTAGIFAKLSDKIFNTKLVDTTKQKGFLQKIIPSVKSIEKLGQEIEQGLIPKNHKKIATGLYWGNMALCAASLAYLVPAICNKMIKKDVKNYVQQHAQNNPVIKLNPVFKDFSI